MTSKMGLKARSKKAKAALRFVGRIENKGGQDRFSVPGSGGKRYDTKIRRYVNKNGHGYISVQCWSAEGDCPGNSIIRRNGKEYKTCCYHSLSSVEFMAQEKGLTVAWCANREDALRLASLGGVVFKVVSHQSAGVVYGVAR